MKESAQRKSEIKQNNRSLLKTEGEPAGFIRRILAIFYDFFIVCSLELLAAGIVVGSGEIARQRQWITLNGYTDINDYMANQPVAKVLYPIYFYMIALLFFSYFWHKGGQTIGMRAWRLHLRNPNRTNLTWSQSVQRGVLALLGIGNLLVLFHPQKKALQDLVTHSEVIHYPKDKK